MEMMRKMSTDEQIDYYLAGERYVHPGLTLQEPIAERGREAVPTIMKRIHEAEGEYQIVELMYLLTYMDEFYYDLRNEAEVLAALEGVAAKMKDPIPKDMAQWKLKGMVENEPPPSGRERLRR